MSLDTIQPKRGRPAGVKSGSGTGGERKKVMIGLYPKDRERLSKLSEEYDLSFAGVIRLSILNMELSKLILKDTTPEQLGECTEEDMEICKSYLEMVKGV